MKYALIAGSESGLAKAAIDTFDSDWFLFCADIAYRETELSLDRMNIPLDVTSNESLIHLGDVIAERTDRLDIVTCFAGIVTLGSMVELPLDTMDRIMSVNFLSQFKINNIMFPFLQEAGGRVITISSEYGVLDALPIHGYYGVSKHAVEAYSDSLRRELQKSGVKVTAIRPGAFKTQMQGGITRQFDTLLEETKMYKRILTLLRGLMLGELEKAKDPSVFADTFRKAAFSEKPRRYYRVNNSFKMKLLSALPPSWQDFIYRIFL